MEKNLENNISYKMYRKLHFFFWNKLKPGKWSLFLYSSYRHYWFCKKKKITGDLREIYMTLEPNRGAGIGHQMGNWLAGYCLAKKLGVNYAYSRFPSVDWDDFLGLGENEITTQTLLKRGYRRKKLPSVDAENEERMKLIKNIIGSYAGKKVIFYLTLDQYYRNIQEAEEHIKDKFYHANSRVKDQLIYDKDTLNVAVHIRRGDIVEGQTTRNPELTKRWLTNDYYVALLKQVVSCIPQNKKYHIYLFSQGKEADFPEFASIPNVSFCFDMSAKNSFLHLIHADILLTSKSSFSYKPALLSYGIKICPGDFWHGYPEDENWIIVDEEKLLTEEQKAILCLMEAKS